MIVLLARGGNTAPFASAVTFPVDFARTESVLVH
jgi:hypothetical protein